MDRVRKKAELEPAVHPCEPIFIVGFTRSGTTMLRLMLNQHPHLAIPFESGFIPPFYERLNKYGDLQSEEAVRRMLADIAAHPKVRKGRLVQDVEEIAARNIRGYADLIDAIFTVYAESKGKRRWGDKTPGYGYHLDLLDR